MKLGLLERLKKLTETGPQLGQLLSTQAAQDLAADLAFLGVGGVSPNPPVGCVILGDSGRLLTYGYHAVYGGPHAEAAAIQRLRDLVGEDECQRLLRGSQVFVTLEPCSHQGKTGACSQLLEKYRPKQVTFAALDTNPLVLGNGAAALKQSGIDCVLDQKWEEDCSFLNGPFLTRMREARPYFALKMATTLNGLMARRGDQRRWLTGEDAREHGRFLRHFYQAILVGVETYLADSPDLTARYQGQTHSVVKIVLDPKARGLRELLAASPKSPQRKILANAKKILWVIDRQNRDSSMSLLEKADLPPYLSLLPLSCDRDGRFSLQDLRLSLWQEKVYSVLVEGGARVHQWFFENNAVDFIHHFMAASYQSHPNALASLPALEKDRSFTLHSPRFFQVGRDFLCEGRVENHL